MNKQRRSLYSTTGLPEGFGVVMLTFALVLFLSPYLAGANFGTFEVPTLTPKLTRLLRIAGPFGFAFALMMFFPLLPTSGAVTTDLDPNEPEPTTKAVVVLDTGGSPSLLLKTLLGTVIGLGWAIIGFMIGGFLIVVIAFFVVQIFVSGATAAKFVMWLWFTVVPAMRSVEVFGKERSKIGPLVIVGAAAGGTGGWLTLTIIPDVPRQILVFGIIASISIAAALTSMEVEPQKED